MSFEYPYLLVLVPALFALIAFMPIARRERIEPIYPSTELLAEVPRSWRVRIRTPLLGGLLSIAIMFLAIAAAAPITPDPRDHQVHGRNLMLALDVSGSMKERDFDDRERYLVRLDAVKRVVSKFIDDRHRDRIGVVVFGTNAFLQCPLTADRELVRQLVMMLEVGVAGDGTAIGEGLGVALKRLKPIESDSRAIVLLTDGANNSGEVNPIQAARIAKQLGIKIHVIGIGSDQNSRLRSLQGLGHSRAEFDEETIQSIAEISGGVYFKARDLAELIKVYAEIDRLESSDINLPEQTLSQHRFAEFALVGLVSLCLYLALTHSLLLRIP